MLASLTTYAYAEFLAQWLKQAFCGTHQSPEGKREEIKNNPESKTGKLVKRYEKTR